MTVIGFIQEYFKEAGKTLTKRDKSASWRKIIDDLEKRMSETEFDDDIFYEFKGGQSIFHPEMNRNKLVLFLDLDSCHSKVDWPTEYQPLTTQVLPETVRFSIMPWNHHTRSWDAELILLEIASSLITDIPHRNYKPYTVDVSLKLHHKFHILAEDEDMARSIVEEMYEDGDAFLDVFEEDAYGIPISESLEISWSDEYPDIKLTEGIQPLVEADTDV